MYFVMLTIIYSEKFLHKSSLGFPPKDCNNLIFYLPRIIRRNERLNFCRVTENMHTYITIIII